MSLSHEDLWSKSKVFIERGLACRDARKYEEFQLWATISLELLAKASLAQKHPCLVADPQNFDSLLVACGLSTSRSYKSIPAKTLFERCKKVLTGFSENDAKWCLSMAGIRNAEIHSGATPYVGVAMESWQSNYWRIVDILVTSQGCALEDFVDEAEASAARDVVTDASVALERAIAGRVERHRKAFDESHPESTQETFRKQVEIAAKARDADSGEKMTSCPSCKCTGILSGEMNHEEWGEYDSEGWCEVTRYYSADQFRCLGCGLKLDGSLELEKAGLEEEYEVEGHDIPEFEDTYMNE